MTTELDHSTVGSLLEDFGRHRDGIWASRTGCISASNTGTAEYYLRLSGGRLTLAGDVVSVVCELQGGSPSSPGDSRRNRLDDNLRGVFS